MRAIDITQDFTFDYIHRVDTGGVALPTIADGQGYKGSLPHLVRRVLKDVGVCYQDYTFVDLGSGKGRTLLIASTFPFRRIIGVEADAALNAVARSNLRCCRVRRQKCTFLRSVCLDVRQFQFPLDPLIVYLFNPFTDSVIREVLQNIQSSLRQKPRPLFLIYLRPLFGEAVDQCGFLQKVSYRKSRLIQNYSYSIYANADYLSEAAKRNEDSAEIDPAYGVQADLV